jgi:hypothetical protein
MKLAIRELSLVKEVDDIMTDFIGEMLKRNRYMAPSKESLLDKIAALEEAISFYDEKVGSHENQKLILLSCKNYIKSAKECMKGFPSHPHLIWNLLHRVDEHLILLMPKDELYSKALDVKTSFDLTITEKKVREDVLGDKGKLPSAIRDIEKGDNLERSRFLVKDALQYLNKNVDTSYWILSMNILMSVCSAALLGVFLLIFIFVYQPCLNALLAKSPSIPVEKTTLITFAILGLMGGYLSNLLTKEDFLFVRGGPFWRYLLHNLMSRPVLGAFSAVFIFLVEKSKLVFSINPTNADGKASAVQSAIININVKEDVVIFAYFVMAIAAGFAGEKLLRNMIDRVLKRMEEKAEKTKEAKTGTDGEKQKD